MSPERKDLDVHKHREKLLLRNTGLLACAITEVEDTPTGLDKSNDLTSLIGLAVEGGLGDQPLADRDLQNGSQPPREPLKEVGGLSIKSATASFAGNTLGRDRGHGIQNGRASGRERVLDGVYISVVAG